MASQIGNIRLIKALGKALGIVDVKQGPTDFDTSQVVSALTIHPGYANYEKWSITPAAAASIATMTGVDISLVAQYPLYTSFPQFTALSQGREMVILGYRIDIDYTAGGAATDANVPLGLATKWYDPALGNGSVAGQLETWAIVVATRLNYSFTFPFWGKQHSNYYTSVGHGNNRLWVPSGSEYSLSLTRQGVGGFPAGTTVQVGAFGVAVPKGICPPLCG